MKVQGEAFKFFVDGESKTVEETKSLIHDNMTITIQGLDVHYFSPKEKYSNWKIEFNVLMEECLKFNHPDLENTKQFLKGCTIPELKNYLIEFKNGNFLNFNKTERLLKEAEEHQKQYGGILQGGEFPFDYMESKYVGDLNYNNPYSIWNGNIPPQVKEVYENMVNNFENGLENAEKETEGQKHNEGKLPIDIMLTVQFPKAIQAICKATLFGHEKYKETDKDWLNYKRVRGGSTTYANAGQRHNFNKSGKDEQSGLPHIIHKCWNAMAELELWIEENKYE
jgi:hypothetical protein